MKLYLKFTLQWKQLLQSSCKKLSLELGKEVILSSYPCILENQIFAGCQDTAIRIWNLKTRKCEKVLTGCHESEVKTIIVYHHYVRSFSEDAIGLWNALDGTLIFKKKNLYGEFHRRLYKNYCVSISKKIH